jgi:hypothetical protein
MKTIKTLKQKQIESGLTQREHLERAIWQYCIDHSKLLDNGARSISFTVYGQEDLMKRVEAREKGLYRNDVDKFDQEQSKRKEEIYKGYCSWRLHEKYTEANKWRVAAGNVIKASVEIKDIIIRKLYRYAKTKYEQRMYYYRPIVKRRLMK